MPVYQFVHSGVALGLQDRERLARGLTEIHHSATNAPEPFIRIVFQPVPLGLIYTAGKIEPSIILNCQIRDGRSQAVRQEIIKRCSELITEVTQLPVDQVVIAVGESPSSWLMEAGFFMPDANDDAEAAWIKRLQETYPGRYDEWGTDGKRPAYTSPAADHAEQLLELAQEMVQQAKREGTSAAGVLGRIGKLVEQELGDAVDTAAAPGHPTAHAGAAGNGSRPKAAAGHAMAGHKA